MSAHFDGWGKGEAGAVLSTDDVYRYLLWRTWDPALPRILWLGFNPSSANAIVADPTVRAAVHFSALWGYGGSVIANKYGFRSPHPKALLSAVDPIGPDNDAAIRAALAEVKDVIVAWGAIRDLDDVRATDVLRMIKAAGHAPMILGRNADGSPRHPQARGKSRVPRDTQPMLMDIASVL